MADTNPDPTVVIGVGGAGVGVVKHTYKALKKENEWEDREGKSNGDGTPEDYFKFLGFDSDEETLEELDEVGISSIVLEDRKAFFDANKSKYPYLVEDFEYSEHGARRIRPIGRHKLDNKTVPGFEDYMAAIDDVIGNHIDYIEGFDEVSRLNIFFVHSLAGGTGSGTFPLIAGIVSNLANELSQDVYVAGIGVVPEMRHAASAHKPGFRPNTYAALNDINKLSDDDTENLPVYSKAELEGDIDDRMENPVETDLDVTYPFDNYWFIGINESLRGEGKGKAQLESYIEEIDNAVAESVLSISRRKEEKENWSAANGVVGSLGEAEVAVPMDLIEEYCETLEDTQELEQELYGGKIPEKYRDLERPEDESTYRIPRKRQLRHIDDRIDEIIDSTIQENFEGNTEELFEDIYEGIVYEGIDGLGFDHKRIFTPDEDANTAIGNIYESVETCEVAKLKVRDIFMEKTEEHRKTVREEYVDTINELATKEMYDVPTADVSRAEIRSSLEKEIRDTVKELETAVESLNTSIVGASLETARSMFFGDWLLPPTRVQVQNRIEEARNDLRELEKKTKLKDNVERMLEELDKRHVEIKRELKDDVRDLYYMKNRLDELKYILSRGSSSTRLGYLLINTETIEEDLSSEWVEKNINNIQDCFDNGLVERKDFEDAIDRQLANSFPWRESFLKLGDPNEIEGEYRGDETQTTWVFYHEDNEEITNDAVGEDADHETQKILRSDGEKLNYSANPFRVKIVSTYNISHIDGLELYQDLDSLAESGTLGTFTNESPYDDWRQAFAYPEWYGDEIRKAFDGLSDVVLFRPPELDWEKDVDFSGIEMDDETYLKKHGIYEYLWQGARWDRYEGDDNWFEGWEETLKEEAEVNKGELNNLGPTRKTRRRWIKGTGDWEDILEEFVSDDKKGGMIEKKGIDVEWDVPEDQKTQTLD